MHHASKNVLLHFSGVAHASCNLNYRLHVSRMKISCFVHNLRGYDAHFIINSARKEHGKISIIANNMEKYISFCIGQICFKDSNQFMLSSLSALSSNLVGTDFKRTRRYWEVMQSGGPTFAQRSDENGEVDYGQPNEQFMPGALGDGDRLSSRTLHDDDRDYRHRPFIPPVLTVNEQRAVEETLSLATRKGVSNLLCYM